MWCLIVREMTVTWGSVESDEMSVQTTRRHIPEPGISDGSFICCLHWSNIRICSHPRIPIHNYVRTTILFNSSVLFRCLSITLAICGGRALLFTTSTYRYHLHCHTHSFLNPAPSLLCHFYRLLFCLCVKLYRTSAISNSPPAACADANVALCRVHPKKGLFSMSYKALRQLDCSIGVVSRVLLGEKEKTTTGLRSKSIHMHRPPHTL